MKKEILPILIILGLLSFTGCDIGTEIPNKEEITVDEFRTAYEAAEDTIISSALDSITSLIPKVIFSLISDDDSPLDHSVIFDNIDLKNDLYSALSGEMICIYSSSTGCEFVMDLEFTGNGTIKTLYTEASFDNSNFDGSISLIKINGLEMDYDFSSLLTTLLITEITSLFTDLF